MLLVLGEDWLLSVYESPEEVSRDIEALDIESSVLDMCDERGQRYGVEWIVPNRYGKILGPLGWCDSGNYRLIPKGEPNPHLPRNLVSRAKGLGRSKRFHSLDEISLILTQMQEKR